MDDVKALRELYESLDSIGAYESAEPEQSTEDSHEFSDTSEPEVTDTPEEQVSSDPSTSLSTIMTGIKSIVSAIQSGEHIDEITSGLHNIAQSVKELSTSVGALEENYGTEGMGPALQKDGDAELQVYTNPCGSSYAERNGFVG